MRIIKRNQYGFTLPEIMVALGLLGGISIITIRLIENQVNNEAHLKAKAEIQKTTALLKTIINDAESCRNMLKEQIIPPDVTVPETRTSIDFPPALPAPSANPALPYRGLYQRIRIPNTPPNTYAYREILAANAKYGLFRTGAIELAKTSHNNTPTAILTPTPMSIDVDSVDLIITFRLESKSIMKAFRGDSASRTDTNDANDRTYLQRIPLLVTFDTATNRIKDCGLVTSESNVAAKQKFCEGLGSNMAVWHAPTQRCNFVPGNTCDPGFIPKKQNTTVTDADDLFECVAIQADEIFDTTATCTAGAGGFSVGPNPTSGKLEVKCNP